MLKLYLTEVRLFDKRQNSILGMIRLCHKEFPKFDSYKMNDIFNLLKYLNDNITS